MQGEGVLSAIAQAPSYIPGGGRSFWKLIGFLLLVIGFLIGRLGYGKPDAISNAIGYAMFYSRSHDAVIRLYDVSRTFHERKGLHFLPRFLAAR